MRTLLLLAIATTLAQDPPAPSVPMGGKVAWGKDPAAAARRARLEQRGLFLYFTDGGTPCKALDSGAFSDDAVVSASQRVLPVLLDCSDNAAHADLKKQHNVSAYPTLLLVEPEGKAAEISAREAADVAAELSKMGTRFPGREVLWLSSIESGLERAKADKRPVALYFHVADEDLAAAQDRVTKIAGKSIVDKFVWVELTATTEEKDPLKLKYEFYSLPAVGFLDPRFPEPKWMTTFEMPAKAKPKDLQDKFEKILKKYRDTKIKK